MAVDEREVSLADLVDRFERELEETERLGKRRLVLVGILFCVVIGYLTWLYSTVTKLDSRMMSEVAAGYIHVNIPEFRDRLRAALTDAAPEVTARSRQAILRAPRFFREQVEASLPYGSNVLAVQFEEELNLYMDATIAELARSVPKGHPEELVPDVRAAFHGMVIKIMDGMQTEFAAELKSLSHRLLKLQSGKGLSEREKVEKEIIEASMVLMDRYRVAGAAAHAGDLFQ